MVVVVVVVSTMQVVMLCSSAPSIKDLDSGSITMSVELISVRFVWSAVELRGLSTSAVVLVLIGISVLAVSDRLLQASSANGVEIRDMIAGFNSTSGMMKRIYTIYGCQ